MGMIGVCTIAALAMLFMVLWMDARAKIYAVKGREEIVGKIESVQKTMDGTLVRVMRLEETAKKHHSEADKEEGEKDIAKKPVTIESVRTALRYNGYSPEIVDTHLDDWQIVKFKINDTNFRIDTSRLPFLTLELGYRLNPDEEEIELMRRAAAEITAGIFIAKVNIHGDGTAVVFNVEFICDNYLHLRDNFKQYLEIIIEAHKRFFETYEKMKDEKKKVLEAAQSFKPSLSDNSPKKALS